VVKKRTILPSEGTHWYLPNGSPFYTVIGANGKERDTTLKDARKVGAGPSTTTITKILAKPQLQNYFEERIFKATLSLEPQPGDDTNSLFAKVVAISRARGKKAARRGDVLHANIENFIWFGTPLDDKWSNHCRQLKRAMEESGFDLEKARSEHSFFHSLGYGGKVDYHDSTPKVADWKTKDKIEEGKKYAFEEHEMQLASYREGLALPNAECWNFFIGELDCKVLAIKHEEEKLKVAWQKFMCLLAYWQLDKQYFPGTLPPWQDQLISTSSSTR